MKKPVLVVLEDHRNRDHVSDILRDEGYSILEAESGARALELLRRHPDAGLILTELELSDMGSEVVSHLQALNAHVPIIVLVKSETQAHLQAVLQSGADDFLLLPPSSLRLKLTVEAQLRHRNLENESYRIRHYAENHLYFKDLVTKSPKMQATIAQAKQHVRRKVNILLCGEEGCEHELLARIFHREDRARPGAFVRIQCSHTAQDDWRTELAAKLMEARHGSLLLADVDRLNDAAQRHLLERIENSSIGSEADIRFMATTHADLAALTLAGSFNAGLGALFADGGIDIAPLRQRCQDIETLAVVILKVVIAETGRHQIGSISKRAQRLLQNYDWPGNLAELENVLFRAVLLSDGPALTVQDFPQIWRRQQLQSREDLLNMERILSDQGGQIFWNGLGHIRPLSDIEKCAIDAALQRYDGRLSETARRLGISRATLYRKISIYEMKDQVKGH